MPRDRPEYDYVIVGGGPAACVLANRISRDPATRVLLLEAGTSNLSMSRRLLGRFTSWLDPHARWQYETVPQPAMNGRRMYLPQGRALGGGSAINAMTYVRGQPADYEAWVGVGNKGWDFETVLAAYKSLEGNQALHDRFHGRDGLLIVSDQVHPHRLTRAFVEAGRQAGFPYNRDFNGSSQEGVGTYQVTQINGKRCSAADAFLTPARGRSNLRIVTQAYATRVCFDRLRATGVEFLANGQLHTVTAEREVIELVGAVGLCLPGRERRRGQADPGPTGVGPGHCDLHRPRPERLRAGQLRRELSGDGRVLHTERGCFGVGLPGRLRDLGLDRCLRRCGLR